MSSSSTDPAAVTVEFAVVRTLAAKVVRRGPGYYIARLKAANIGTSGDTRAGALANLRDLVAETFALLDAMPAAKLGRGPTRDLAALRAAIAGGNDAH